MNAPVEDLCRVSGEVAATLTRLYRVPGERPGDYHIFKNGLHGKLTVLEESDGFRIVAPKKSDRDGTPFTDLIDAVQSALNNQNTAGFVFGRVEYNDSHGKPTARDYLRTQGSLSIQDGIGALVKNDKRYNILIM